MSMQTWYRWQGVALLLRLRVQPNARNDQIVGPCDDGLGGQSLKVRISATPVDGKANAHLVKFMAKAFGVSKSQVHVEGGQNGRQKRLRIDAPSQLPALITRP
jgi:uncharacterized protein